jgi:hypothetical protein
MPSLDVETLADAGHRLDHWPDRATGDFDGQPPAMMKLLLAGDEKARAAMQLLGADFDFFDIDPDDGAHLLAAADLATATEKLLAALASDKASQPATRGLTSSLVNAARQAWSTEGSEKRTSPQPGTWFVDDVSLSIRYQPTGHADPVLKAWYDAVVTEAAPWLREALVAEFTGPSAPGRCTTCHSIDSTPEEGGLVINWHAHERNQQPRSFTRFSHAPHLLPMELRDCAACHAINHTANTANNYGSHNPAAFVSDFHPVSKATCAACHNKSAVGESCTQCHNYHVEQW